MFDQKQIDDYRQITAPTALKTAVLDASKPIKKPIPMRRVTAAFTAIAACFVLLIIGNTLRRPASPIVELDGQVINNDNAVVITHITQTTDNVAAARAQQTARFTLTADGNITVSTKSEGFFVCDTDVHTPLTSHTAKDSVMLEWLISDEAASLTVNDVLYSISADPQTGEVSVQKSVQD